MDALIKQLQKLIKNALSLSPERKVHLLSLLPTLSKRQLENLQSILDLEKIFIGAVIKAKLETPEGEKAVETFMQSFDKVLKKVLVDKELDHKAKENEDLQALEEEINNL